MYNVSVNSEKGVVFVAKKLAVIGAGASGLVSAIEAKIEYPKAEITIFERLQKPGKKLLVTGNGRCNFANVDLSPKHFYGDNEFLRGVLTSPHADTENYFRNLGVLAYHEDGRIYPRSQQSATIRDALISKVLSLNIKIATEVAALSIKAEEKGFKINGEYFDAVIIAGGGKAAPVHGSDGSCLKLLKNMGYEITELYPALCGLTTKEKFISSLKGVRAEAKAMLYSGTKHLGEEFGEVQFTENAVSGIPVMNLSHLCKSNKALCLKLDLCNELSESELKEHFREMKTSSPDAKTELVLSGIVNIKLGYAIMKMLNIKAETTIDALTPRSIEQIINTLKCFEINITGTKDFNNAQITCGGIKTKQIDVKTMMSKLHPGLFMCGEILDIHGDCGGYNLHLAWTTGRIAGSCAAEYLKG